MARRLIKVTDQKGMTMVELLVAMAISSILMVGVVAASLFLQRYMNNWQSRSKLLEELSFGMKAITSRLEVAKSIRQTTRGLECYTLSSTRDVISCKGGRLIVNEKPVTLRDVQIDSLGIERLSLSKPSSDTIFSMSGVRLVPGLFRVTLIGSTRKGLSDTLVTTVRCNYEYFKYAP